ncbi:hypothetical protein HDU91_004964, partial [Kappamyces sp. JEL0680]
MQLMPPNFTQILDKESKVLEGLVNPSESYEARQELKELPIYRNMKKRLSEKRLSQTRPGQRQWDNPTRHRPVGWSHSRPHLERYPSFGNAPLVGAGRHDNAPTLSRLNEVSAFPLIQSDEESAPALPKPRLFGLLQTLSAAGGKPQLLPLNINDMIAEEQSRLLTVVQDDEAKEAFRKAMRLESLSLDGSAASVNRVEFEQVSGFDHHIQSLKEMVGLPFLYPEVFDSFSITPPKGVLFHGPPGTGKTMMARALATSCSTSSKSIAFFMRKGADILSKWVGESESQLRAIFEQAKAFQPSIIFFDEIDGAELLSDAKQDQIHASVVSTLLALMDGLDSRGQVIVIGATNRIDAIDPALRRPGRFDREFYFGLPNEEARKKIIRLATHKWTPPLSCQHVDHLAAMTRGYNGADVRALCTESALHAVRRTFPQIYDSHVKYDLPIAAVSVTIHDFQECMAKMAPSTERSLLTFGRPLPQHVFPLLEGYYGELSEWLKKVIPVLKQSQRLKPAQPMGSVVSRPALCVQDYLKCYSPRLCLYGSPGAGQDLIGSALMAVLEEEEFYIRTVDANTLISNDSTQDSILLGSFCELKRHRRAVLYLPSLHSWWYSVQPSTRDNLLNLLDQTRHSSLFIVMTMEWLREEIPAEICSFVEMDGPGRRFGEWKLSRFIDYPDDAARRRFFDNLLADLERPEEHLPDDVCQPSLSLVPAKDSVAAYSETESRELYVEFETHKRKLRQVFSAILADLRKEFKILWKLCDRVGSYRPQNPMDLARMEDRVQADLLETPDDFLNDIGLVSQTAEAVKHSAPPNQRESLSRARALADSANEHIHHLAADFVQCCWYFYLFKRSGIFEQGLSLPQETARIAVAPVPSALPGAATDLDNSSGFEPVTQYTPTQQVCVESNDLADMFDDPIQPLSQSTEDNTGPARAKGPAHDKGPAAEVSGVRADGQDHTSRAASASFHLTLDDTTKSRCLDYLVSHTSAFSCNELEDVGAQLAVLALSGVLRTDALQAIQQLGLNGNTAITKILIANNGMAAVKAIRSIRKWSYETFGTERAVTFTAMSTPEDLKMNAEYIRMADNFIEVPGGSGHNNYSNVDLIVDIAERTKVHAVWADATKPLQENPVLAERLAHLSPKIVFIGPPPTAMRSLGDKIASTIVAQSAE